MDESWRMRMGTPSSTKPAHLPGRKSAGDSLSLDPINFSDVFGGPPRSVLSRQFPSVADFSRQTFSYEEIFQQPFSTTRPPERNSGVRNLPEFRIPKCKGGRNKDNEEEFYGDIFGDVRRSRSRSHQSVTNSSSVLSSEELSPFRSAVVDDDVSLFASKLRPINVSSKWNSTALMHEVRQMPDFPSNHSSYFENQLSENEHRENFKSSHSGCSGKVSSPETIHLEPSSYCSIKVSVEDLQLNSPSSVVSSLCHDHETEASISLDQVTQEQRMVQEDEDEIMSSYVIEINLDKRKGTNEALGIDEAIAWAKEKCQAPSDEKEWSFEEHDQEDHVPVGSQGNVSNSSLLGEKEWSFEEHDQEDHVPVGSQERPDANHVIRQIHSSGLTLSELLVLKYTKRPEESATEEEKQQLERDIELELLDEDVRLWSAGNETNIRLLLSTLHHILWPNSGWHTIPSSNLKESADVKKAYQKARLCLHPDKLQQRGATFPQKYVADKAFPILQDAWAAFISQDVL